MKMRSKKVTFSNVVIVTGVIATLSVVVWWIVLPSSATPLYRAISLLRSIAEVYIFAYLFERGMPHLLPKGSHRKVAVLACLFAFLRVGILLEILISPPNLPEDTAAWLLDIPIRPPGVLVITLLGIGMFEWRKRSRTTYGLAEIVFAAITAYLILPPQALPKFDVSQIQAIALLSGCVYVMVRGWDNITEGMKTDPIAKWLGRKVDALVVPSHRR